MSLFPLEPVMPEGFFYRPNFITEAEELALLNNLKELALKPLIFQGFEAKRKVASFGYSYHFDTRTITKGKEIPEEIRPFINKIENFVSLPAESIAQVLVTEYPPGSVINWHRDAPPFDVIIGLSLLADCQFKLRPYEKAKQGRKSVLSTTVARRSLYVLRGAARADWEHSTAPVTESRYSLTFRTLR